MSLSGIQSFIQLLGVTLEQNTLQTIIMTLLQTQCFWGVYSHTSSHWMFHGHLSKTLCQHGWENFPFSFAFSFPFSFCFSLPYLAFSLPCLALFCLTFLGLSRPFQAFSLQAFVVQYSQCMYLSTLQDDLFQSNTQVSQRKEEILSFFFLSLLTPITGLADY